MSQALRGNSSFLGKLRGGTRACRGQAKIIYVSCYISVSLSIRPTPPQEMTSHMPVPREQHIFCKVRR